jgi:hypothetical protein
MNRQSCSYVIENGVRRTRPAVARWTHWHGYTTLLCQDCLDAWLDNADDDETLEPKGWRWLR